MHLLSAAVLTLAALTACRDRTSDAPAPKPPEPPASVVSAGIDAGPTATSIAPLPAPKPPARIPVAFVLTPGAEVVDFAGPWGVFEYVLVDGYDQSVFQLYTVAERAEPFRLSGGLTVVPDYTFASAPPPKIVVVPAQEGEASAAEIAWLRRTAPGTDLTMSVCNGAFVLGQAGLLDGKAATSHHNAYALFEATFPEVTLRRGARFVDADGISTAGGLTSGIDLALHVVERYFGRAVAEQTATLLEYQGQGWKDPASNAAFAAKPVSTPDRPICPVCEMPVDQDTALHGTFHGHEYAFCSASCKAAFDKAPERFAQEASPAAPGAPDPSGQGSVAPSRQP